ncbi:MAG: RNA polymerase sigma-70 factor [Bacteroidetes bacterium]|nr:RNA polymerase sigma-70 factor [Bacteroidota bacterium]
MEWDDIHHLRLLKDRDETAFEALFKHYFKRLRQYAYTFVQDQELAEDIVQNVFFRLWEKIEVLNFSDSIAAYLYRAIYNESLNHLKHIKVKRNYQSYLHRRLKNESDNAQKKLHLDQLEQRLREAINDLPEQCRTIFQLSRFEELRYREIGLRLGISVKTVENQMGKALKVLRARLVDFLPLLLLYITNNF